MLQAAHLVVLEPEIYSTRKKRTGIVKRNKECPEAQFKPKKLDVQG
jgi:hypothetical protein